ncbi:hypothetical protein V0R48_14350 [Pseudomonas alcaligenes]|uniref:hypothetical protein n=1 Tax=Aquipseudomonas alcaligenes TaxID=43263 RepID=UPI002E7AF2D6|nr:hypothetical protein [Pseudomonas alcaligenes]MEE1950166.1 hypothetical protein [Pseudomonas alcaligenes]
MPRLAFIIITTLCSLSLHAQESTQWIARTSFNIEGANYIETLTFVSGISYALTESAKELSKQNKQNFFCAPANQKIDSELLMSILNSRHSGSIASETAISTIVKELTARFPCANTAHNNTLNTVRFAHWTRKSYAFARLLA